MDQALRAAQPGVVTLDDMRVLGKAFGRINREAKTLVMWLRFTRLERPRN